MVKERSFNELLEEALSLEKDVKILYKRAKSQIKAHAIYSKHSELFKTEEVMNSWYKEY